MIFIGRSAGADWGWRRVAEDRLLRAIARLLPRDFRDRVFLPALSDLWLDEAGESSVWRRCFVRGLLVLECLRLGIPQHFWRRRRPTRLAFVVMGMLAVLELIARHRYMRG